jgi:hypothetical protein
MVGVSTGDNGVGSLLPVSGEGEVRPHRAIEGVQPPHFAKLRCCDRWADSLSRCVESKE